MEELISVIVPIYKVEAYLERCIGSIVNQTYQNLEIILVDDGSPDSCPDICDAWKEKDDRIKVIHKKMAVCLMQEMQECRLWQELIYLILTVMIGLQMICMKR